MDQSYSRRRLNLFTLVVWGVMIVFAVLIFLVRSHEIGKRPVVIATASNQHVVNLGKGGLRVFATVEFDRPGKDGPIHCKTDNQRGWDPSNPKAFDAQIHLAVRPDSCYDTVRVPWPPQMAPCYFSAWPYWRCWPVSEAIGWF